MSFSTTARPGDAAGVERTHRELRAGLADGLAKMMPHRMPSSTRRPVDMSTP